MQHNYLNYLSVIILALVSACKTSNVNQSKLVETIELENTGCLNKCKAYKITISNSGYATYEGILNVPRTGKYDCTLKKVITNDLWETINRDSLLKMEEAYNYGDEDTQQHFLKYFSDGKLIKEIRFGPFPPAILTQISQKLDSISESSRWKAIK